MHYHGTPITPRTQLLRLAGRCFCVSYADPRDLEVCHEIGQSVMFDNGAFSFWQDIQKGRRERMPDWDGYYAWCEPWLRHWTTWAVIPDVIDGGEQANDELLARWPFGTRGAPVWHLDEDLDRLDRLVSTWPLVCLGSSGKYAKPGGAPWHRRMAQAMRVACDPAGVPRTRLHMLRGLQFADGPYPFFSADSTSIAQNHAGNNTRRTPAKDVVRMAEDLDGRQPAVVWRPTHDQLAMEAA